MSTNLLTSINQPTQIKSKVNLSLGKGGIGSNLKGISYQLKVLLLMVIKCFRIARSKFSASTEVEQAQSFDDVVLLLNNKTFFIQTKTKETPVGLEFKDFFDQRNKNFNLCKYYIAFLKVLKSFKSVQNVVICTNDGIVNSQNNPLILSDGSGREIKLKKLTSNDEIFGNFNKCFEIDSTCSTTFNTMKKGLQDGKTAFQIHDNQLADDKINWFLGKLLLIFDLTEEDLDKAINEFLCEQFKLTEASHLNFIVTGLLYDWVKSMKTLEFIDRKKFDNLLTDIKHKTVIIPKVIDRSSRIFQDLSFELKNPGEIKQFVSEIEVKPYQFFYLKTAEGEFLLGGSIIYQEMKQKESDNFIFVEPSFSSEYMDDALNIFSTKSCFLLLIIIQNAQNDIAQLHKIKLDGILKDPMKKILVVTDQEQNLLPNIQQNQENFLQIDKIKLFDLKKNSLKLLLQKTLNFQEESVKLHQILDSSDHDLLDSIYLADLLATASIGCSVISGKNYDQELFIPRTLQHKNHIKYSVFSGLNKLENEKVALDEISYDNFCLQFPAANVHLLTKQSAGDNFIWKKTRGSLLNLMNHVDDESGTPFQPIWVSNVQSQTVCALADVAGMGKTTWMNNAAVELKSKFQDHFVINICLNNYTEFFDKNDFKDEEAVIEFFQDTILNLTRDIEKKLFRAACKKSGKVQVILDGLDEVFPESEVVMFNMIKIIRGMKLSGFYISTRPELKKEVAEQMESLGYELVPFSIKDQISFLKKYWGIYNTQNLADDYLELMANKVLDSIRSSLSDKEMTITGIPLITKMVAEIFLSKICDALQNNSRIDGEFSNLTDLYKEFIDKKIERFLVEKLSMDLSKARNKRLAEKTKLEIFELYMKLSCKQIVPQYFSKFYKDLEFTELEIEDMRKCGLVISDNLKESANKFIHKTFSEFFLFRKLRENFSDPNCVDLMVNEIFVKDSFMIIRFFLNNSLKLVVEENFKSYANAFQENQEKLIQAMEKACKENNLNLLDFILQSLLEMSPGNVPKMFRTLLFHEGFIDSYLRYVNDDLKFLETIKQRFGLEMIGEALVENECWLITKSICNPENCKFLLSWMRSNFSNNNVIWLKFSENCINLLENVLRMNYDKSNLLEILNEFELIEKSMKIKFFEVQILKKGLFQNPNHQLNFKPIINFLCWLIKTKGLRVFRKILVPKTIRMKTIPMFRMLKWQSDIFQHENTNENSLENLKRLASRQVVMRCQGDPDIKEKLLTNHLEIQMDEENKKLIKSLLSVFKTVNGEAEYINEMMLTYISSFHLSENLGNPAFMEVFFNEVAEYKTFDNILGLNCFNGLYKETDEIMGRFIFDGVLDVGNFFSKLSRKKITESDLILSSYYELDITEDSIKNEFSCYLLSSMITAIKSDKDREILKMLLALEDLNDSKQQSAELKDSDNLVFPFPQYFSSYLNHWMTDPKSANVLSLDTRSIFQLFKFQKFDEFAENLEIFIKLFEWNIKTFQHEPDTLAPILCSQNFNGNTFLHRLKNFENFSALTEIIPNEILKDFLRLRNKKGLIFLRENQKVPREVLEAILEKLGRDFLREIVVKEEGEGQNEDFSNYEHAKFLDYIESKMKFHRYCAIL